MADYGRAPAFGVFPTPEAETVDDVIAMAEIADREGLELIGIQDHPYQRRHLDTWMLMATILARTDRIRVFPDVANLPLRLPAVMAKAAASLDVLSGGRFELGLGAGAFYEAVVAMGGPDRTGGQAATALAEAVEIIRGMWSDQRSVRFSGEHYQVSGVKPGPYPAHEMELWLGVGGPRMLDLLGRRADGWIPSSSYFPRESLLSRHERIDEAAVDTGRDPSSIRRLYNVLGRVTDGASNGWLSGPAAQWVDELTELTLTYGMDAFIFGPATDPVRQTHRFAEDVVPAVRAAVDRERGGTSA